MEDVVLLSNGDFRDPVGVNCWPKQEETLREVEGAFAELGIKTLRGNPFKPQKKHGFITTQAEGCKVFSQIKTSSPVVVVMASWVWAHHLASSMALHKGPILLLGNFDGTWPGLVSLLNHAATYERLGIKHSRIWSDAFAQDPRFMQNLKIWIKTGKITYSQDHITNLNSLKISNEANAFGEDLALHILKHKRILGQFDPGCMGMLNAVVSPDLVISIGMPVEFFSQSDLLAEMKLITEQQARSTLDWLSNQGATFDWGTDEATELTERQVLQQMRMYHAAGRMYARYGMSALGVAYQYGLVRCTSASDLPEGMLNNSNRPEILHPESGKAINPGKPIVHFNEGDVGSAVPQVIMNEILSSKAMPPETTLHDVRWGAVWQDKFVWVFEISGGAPPTHFGGWKNTHIYRQPPMYFPNGGGTCSGVSKPGKITWARFYESFGKIGMDMGTGESLELPKEEIQQRLNSTTKEWPIANVYIPGYDRDEMMSSHKSNHITICYGNILPELAATAKHLGIDVNIVGDAIQELSKNT